MKLILPRLVLSPFIALFAVAHAGAAEEGKPNIVLIMADDLGYADLGCYGNQEVETPHLDRLAAEGLRFTDFHSNAPVCSPTRAALLTGRYQQRAGVHAVYQGELQRSEITIAQRLRDAGYATGIFGKWHVSGHARTEEAFSRYEEKVPTSWGFDRFTGIMSGMVDGISHYTERGFHDWWQGDENVVEEGYATHLLTKHAIEFIHEKADRPFFVYVPFTDIHFPWMTPEDPPYYAAGVDNPAEAFPERKRGGQHHGTDQLQEVVHRMIAEVDTGVGRIVSTLEELGLSENTLVLFTSDNGGYSGYQGHNQGEISAMGPYRGQKHEVYEGGIRVPLIAWQPGRIAPGVSEETAMTFDFFPTFLEAAGLEAPEKGARGALDGVSLLSLLQEGEPLPKRRLFWNDLQKWAAREGDWKLVVRGPKSAPELYHLEEDPGEAQNLAATHPGRVEQFLQAMTEWASEVGTLYPPPGVESNARVNSVPLVEGTLLFTDRQFFVTGEGTRMEPVVLEAHGWEENDGEKLYNGIVLPQQWPPSHLKPASQDPMPVPYLDHPPEVIPIDLGRQLFVDDFLIEKTDLERHFHHPEKFAGNPVFRAETETEKAGNEVVYLGQGGVFYDPSESHYKMYYTAGWRGPLALATSPDLVEWTRPDLGLHRDNWLLPPGLSWQGRESTTAGSDNAVWFDPAAEDPMDRIRYLTCWMHAPKEQRPSGFTHSLQTSDGRLWSPATPTAMAGDYGSFYYNPFRKKWIHSIKQGGPRGRCRFYLETDRFLEGTNYEEAVYWTNADRLDQPEPEASYPGDPQPPQLYSLAGVAYESLMIGMHQIHRGPENGICAEKRIPKLTDLEIGFSRDGFHWHRPDRSGFIRGERSEDAWDRAYLHTTTGVFVVHEDQLVFPYCAYSGLASTGGRGIYHGASIGIATLRRDGFASMKPRVDSGTLTTRQVTFSGRHLFANLDAPEGELRVEILDTNGEPIARSKPLSGDTTRSLILWEDREDLADLAGKPVRFRFELKDGALYAFWVSPDRSGRSGGYLGASGAD